MTYDNRLLAFSAGRQLMTRRQKADTRWRRGERRKADAWHHFTAGSRRRVCMWGLAPSGCLCTAEWFITQHVTKWPKSGGRITLRPHCKFWGTRLPSPQCLRLYSYHFRCHSDCQVQREVKAAVVRYTYTKTHSWNRIRSRTYSQWSS